MKAIIAEEAYRVVNHLQFLWRDGFAVTEGLSPVIATTVLASKKAAWQTTVLLTSPENAIATWGEDLKRVNFGSWIYTCSGN